MSVELFKFFQDIQKIRFPIQRGSLRLRVSPSGKRGLWLDFANEDIRDLLQEKTILSSLLEMAVVEMGQRRKKLTSEMKLKDPEFHPWTRTWIQEQTVDLFSTVGSFSQTGDLANRTLVSEIQKFFTHAECDRWVEFGSGAGNLTFPLASHNRHVKALEVDGLALQGLQITLQSYPSFQERIDIRKGDYQQKNVYQFEREESVLVNPPRSGLQNFLTPLISLSSTERPKNFIYMSCYLESFCRDAQNLKNLGYRLEELSLVDQFPHSSHFEILSRWKISF